MKQNKAHNLATKRKETHKVAQVKKSEEKEPPNVQKGRVETQA